MSELEMVIGEVERYYVAGQNSLREHPVRLPWGSGLTASETQKLRLQRRFADAAWGYTPEGLRELVARFRERGFALTASTIGTLMGVPPGPARDRLVADAVGGHWPQSRVAREIKLRKLTEPKAGQGRTVKPPDTLKEVLGMLEADYCPQWRRALSAVLPEDGDPPVELPAAVEREVRAAKDAIGKLEKAARLARQRRP